MHIFFLTAALLLVCTTSWSSNDARTSGLTENALLTELVLCSPETPTNVLQIIVDMYSPKRDCENLIDTLVKIKKEQKKIERELDILGNLSNNLPKCHNQYPQYCNDSYLIIRSTLSEKFQLEQLKNKYQKTQDELFKILCSIDIGSPIGVYDHFKEEDKVAVLAELAERDKFGCSSTRATFVDNISKIPLYKGFDVRDLRDFNNMVSKLVLEKKKLSPNGSLAEYTSAQDKLLDMFSVFYYDAALNNIPWFVDSYTKAGKIDKSDVMRDLAKRLEDEIQIPDEDTEFKLRMRSLILWGNPESQPATL